jgi:hypothetical protein
LWCPGWEACSAEAIETRQFIFIFDEVKLQLKKNVCCNHSLSHR